MVRLSDRMQAVADLVTPGLCVADIGCDHGYLPIFLVKQGIAPSAVAMDIKEGPLQAAREHIHREGLDDFIKTRRSDGLTALLPGEAESVVIAGMGGRLALKILKDAETFMNRTRDIREVIVQPQSELAVFRSGMQELGYICVRENMVFEDGKFYPMGRYLPVYAAGKEDPKLPEDFLSGDKDLAEEYGAWLLHDRHPVLSQYLEKEYRVLETIRKSIDDMQDEEGRRKRLWEVDMKIRRNERGRSFFRERSVEECR